jgi:hypothetical protein
MEDRKSNNRFRITSIIIAAVMLMGAFAALIGPFTINVSATITGDTYSGSGDWTITNPTVYTGETLIVYGNININGAATLTLSNTHLTIDCPAGGAQVRTIDIGMAGSPYTGGLIVTAASIIDTTNATAGKFNVKITTGNTAYIYCDNSTLKNIYHYHDGIHANHYSNSTLEASVFYPNNGNVPTNRGRLTFAYDDFLNTNTTGLERTSVVELIVGNSINHCTFENITLPSHTGSTCSMIRSISQHTYQINDNNFGASYYGSIYIGHNAPHIQSDVQIHGNYFGVMGNDYANRTQVITIAGKGATTSEISENVFYDLRNATFGIMFSDIGPWVIHDNVFSNIDGTALTGLGTACGIYIAERAPATASVQITDNHFDRVTGPDADIGSTGNGIFSYLGGNFTISGNQLHNISSISNGIAVMAGGGRNIIIENNVVTNIFDASAGIGLYGGYGAVVRNNTMTTLVDYSCMGIRIAFAGVNQIIENNTVSGLGTGMVGVMSSRGAYSVNGETYGLQNAHFINNTVIGTVSADYPSYNITGSVATSITITLKENALIRYQNANVTVGGFETTLLLTNQTTNYAMTYYPDGTSRSFFPRPDASAHLLWATVLPISITTTDEVNVTFESSLQWSANATSGTITFTLSGLESGRMYRLYVDGVASNLLTATGGTISFTYSGPWSEHQFEIVATSVTGSISPLVNLIFIMFAIGVVVGVIAEGTYSIRKNKMLSTPEMMKLLFNMVIYIVIGIAGIGVLYSIVV